MTLIDIIDVITRSDTKEWNHISCWGAFSAPSYRDKFEFYETFNGSENVLHHDAHSDTAAYKDDLSITIAWGLVCNEEFVEDWANNNPASNASSHFLDVFYNGALVFRTVYVVVDGGRCSLPVLRKTYDKQTNKVISLSAPRGYYKLISLLDAFGKISSFDSYWSQAGAVITDEQWPG
jgi:hypothetical protein